LDPIKGTLDTFLDPKNSMGRAPEQVDKFIEEWVQPVLDNGESRDDLKVV
jgi:adenylosuccinate lyase